MRVALDGVGLAYQFDKLTDEHVQQGALSACSGSGARPHRASHVKQQHLVVTSWRAHTKMQKATASRSAQIAPHMVQEAVFSVASAASKPVAGKACSAMRSASMVTRACDNLLGPS